MIRSTAEDTPRGASARRFAFGAFAVVAVVAYLVALHALVVSGIHPHATLLLILAPWMLAAALSFVRGRRLAAAATMIVVILIAWSVPTARIETLLYVENVVFVASLSWLFGRSLSGGRQPLVTRLARASRNGDMPPPVLRYTRLATGAWAAFFMLEAVVSSVLFFTRSLDTWSMFVNLLQLPLIVVAFAVEYGVRRCVLRDIRHSSPLEGFRTFARRDDLARDEQGGGAR